MKTVHDDGDAALRMALRGLRRDADPGRDLWPGIAARIERNRPTVGRASRRWHGPGSLALAASLVIATGLAWQAGQGPGVESAPRQSAPDASPQPATLQQDADVMTAQYRAAMNELRAHGPAPESWQPGLQALDRSAAEIRAALREAPDSRLLFDQLRQTYVRRIALSRRALYS